MPQTYKVRHGIDWPIAMHDVMCDFVYGKKWREFQARGDEIKVEPWIPYLNAMKTVYGSAFKVSDWTKDHVKHWVMREWPIYWGSASCGKAQPLDAPVMSPSGPRTMGELQVGDYVIGVDGKPTKIKAVHLVGDQEVYKVSFRDGTSALCAGTHLWETWDRQHKYRKQVLQASEIESASKYHSYAVRLPSPVHFDPVQAPIDPYVLGALLGNGSLGASSGKSVLSFTNVDADIVSEMRSRMVPGYVMKRIAGKRDCQYMIARETRFGSVYNSYRQNLMKLGLWTKLSHEKFIPRDYLINSVEVREQILAGLMDTDGYVKKCGGLSFSTTSPQLAKDVAWLVRSLGGIANVTKRGSGYRDKNGSYVKCRDQYYVGIHMDDASRLFKCRRKLERVRNHRRCSKYRYIKAVTRTGDVVPMKCITVEHPSGLYLTNDFIVTHNSNDVGACVIPDFIADPHDTITLIGSTTRPMLQKRIWEAILRYLGAFQDWARSNGFVLPVRVADAGYAILNEKDSDDAASMAVKAGIHGVALDEGGKLQGAHMPYVRVIVDELATIRDQDAIVTALANLQIAKDFKFAAMANPEPWNDPSSAIFCTPVDGIDSVSVESREWSTTFGAHVLHDDGFKSPCVVHPELADEYPFLTSKKHLDTALKIARGDPNNPSFWKMARGFPLPAGTGVPPILDPAIAIRNKICEPAVFDMGRWRGTAEGIDPAWTSNGDGACRARCYLMVDEFGKMYLDFTGGLEYLRIDASVIKTKPAVEQLTEQVVAGKRVPFSADFKHTAVDSSGNQGLGSSLKMYAGAYDIMEVNYSDKASPNPPMKFDTRPAEETIADRGTESWVVLARYCEAGMVKGLPEAAKNALITRHYTVENDKKTGEAFRKKGKDRLESKKDFKPRFNGKSPDEADACALAALIIKEVYGVPPFGYMDYPVRDITKTADTLNPALPSLPVRTESYDNRCDDSGDDGYAALA